MTVMSFLSSNFLLESQEVYVLARPVIYICYQEHFSLFQPLSSNLCLTFLFFLCLSQFSEFTQKVVLASSSCLRKDISLESELMIHVTGHSDAQKTMKRSVEALHKHRVLESSKGTDVCLFDLVGCSTKLGGTQSRSYLCQSEFHQK